MSLFSVFAVSASALSAQSKRLNVVASNLANADAVAGPDGQGYKGRQVVFETADASVWVAEAQTTRHGGTLTSVTDLVANNGAPFALDRSAVKVTVLGQGKSVEISGCPAP